MLKRAIGCIGFFLLTTFFTLYGQENVDSLFIKLQAAKSGTEKVLLFQSIAKVYSSEIRDNSLAEKYYNEALSLANSLHDTSLTIECLDMFGVFYRNRSSYSRALELHFQALDLANTFDSKLYQAKVNNNIGVVYRRLDNHARATEYHLAALTLSEEIKDTFSTSVALNSLGNIYSLNGQYKDAIQYFERALELSAAQKNVLGLAINNNNIGEVYEFSGNMEKAQVYYQKSLDYNRQINSDKGIAISLNALGKIHLYYNQPKLAYSLFNQALAIDKRLGDRKFIADSYTNLGKSQVALGMYDEAELTLGRAIHVASEINSLYHFQVAYEELSNLELKRRSIAKAFDYFKKAVVYKDSIINEKNDRHIASMRILFESEKKEKEIQILRQRQELDQKEIDTQNKMRNYLLGGLTLSFLLLSMAIFAFNNKKRANRILAQQKAEIEKANFALREQKEEIETQKEKIEQQNHNIEQKNKHLEDAYLIIEDYIGKITDSIKYAERIQQALLSPLSLYNNFFAESFIFASPKDIVSGDFYWFASKDDTCYFAVADCTGHGVPGAFMSIIGMDLLNQGINQFGLAKTDELLHFINEELRVKLRKKENDELVLKDSMDIALCSFNRATREFTYSGALIPVFVVQGGVVTTLKPDYTSIGAGKRIFNGEFKTQRLTLSPDDWIYISTDGFTDQFGGLDKKKYMRSRLVQNFARFNHLPANQQYSEFKSEFFSWKRENEQIDDVLFLGLKV
ncbi:MAG: tetratricopeptide repeat protein [Bacteroidales bacterium]|nr:tetratricopeptide repeat protein [Bacteroidales bacterium]MBN2750033.1 tetratricopeptide repeat protein [Bacteroidales bacterium]